MCLSIYLYMYVYVHVYVYVFFDFEDLHGLRVAAALLLPLVTARVIVVHPVR